MDSKPIRNTTYQMIVLSKTIFVQRQDEFILCDDDFQKLSFTAKSLTVFTLRRK